MGVIGEVKEAARRASGLLERIQRGGGVAEGLEAALADLGQEIKQLQALTAALSETAEDVHTIIEGLEDAPKWVQSLVRTGERTLWRYSNLATGGIHVEFLLGKTYTVAGDIRPLKEKEQ